MMRKALSFVALLALALPAAAQVVAEDPPPDPGKQAVVRFLELTPEQVTAWDALLATLEGTVRPLREQLRAVEEQLRALLEQPSPDPASVGALVIQGKALRDQIGDAHVAYVEGFEALLGDEQQAKLEFLRRAERAQPLIPAFRHFRLLGPAEPPQPPR